MRLLFVGCLWLMMSCTSPQKILLGTWQVADIDFNENLVADPSKKPEVVNQLKEKMRVTFTKEGKYVVKLPESTEVGTWQYDKKTKSIVTRNEHSGAKTTIQTISAEKIQLDVNDENGTNMKLTLVPVK
ncbi:MAG: hypothetical protein JNK66_02185 [Chitinophagales bacterium]|nr:hypothetical protein [Chitinophagales bacterium]